METVFALSKNLHPVPTNLAIDHLNSMRQAQKQWAEKAANDAFTMYSNYAKELGLLAKMDRNFYLTPHGLKFISLFELNKSIEFVNAL